MPLYYIVEPYNVDFEKINVNKFKNQYKGVLDFIEKMNIRHEFLKVLNIAYRDDVFYGYEHMSDNSYFIQKLDPEFCQISSQEDGCFNFAFDFSYFTTNPEQLDMYPSEFKKMYNRFRKDPSKMKWQELDPERTICIKINEDLDYIMPPFFSTFESIFDIEDYKALRKDREEISNYKILIQKIPVRLDSENNNDFAIDLETAMAFHNKAAQVLPDQVGIITGPFETDSVSFEKDQADFDNVAKAERDFWNTTGVSQLLFNADKTTSIGLSKSIQTDEAMAFGVIRQVERWINRRIKYLIGTPMFKVRILDISIFNQHDFFTDILQAGQFGMPVKMAIAASLGFSPSSMINMIVLENDILGLNEKLIPLQSSHTTDGTDGNGAGAPSKGDKVSDEGLKARDGNKGNNN
jgi:hypothetical protein